MFPLLEEAISPDINVKDNVTYVTSIGLYHGANLDEEQSRNIKQIIKNLIDSPETRYKGLLLFEKALKQKTPFYMENWPYTIVANLEGIDVHCKRIAFRILKLCLRKLPYGNYRTTARHHVKSFVRQLIKEENMSCLVAVQCLSVCIKVGDRMLLDMKTDIEKSLVKQIDTPSTKMSEAVADCYTSLLYVIEVPQGKNSAFSKTYGKFQKKVFYTLQEILKKLLCISEEFPIEEEDNDDIKETFDLPDTTTVHLSTCMTLARIFSTLSKCASKILSSEIIENEEVNVPILWILEFINRVFEIPQVAELRMNKEHIFLIYPMIHNSTFVILESLILHFDIVEQVENIVRLMRNSIEASYKSTFSDECNSEMRYTTWKVLNIWQNRYGLSVSLNVGNKEYLVEEMLKDITVEASDDQLLVNNKRPSARDPVFFPDPAEKSSRNRSKIKACNEALRVLRSLIYTASPFLEEKLKQKITSTVISTSKEIQKRNCFKIYPFPYMDEECRCNLYELNLAFLVSSNNFKIQVLTQSNAVLKLALRDHSIKIKEFCQRATSMRRQLLHMKKKLPDAFTHKKSLFEPVAEENLCHGWENVPNWLANCVNHNTSAHINVSQETEKNENKKQDTSSNKEYNSSDADSASYTKEEIQCNGDGITEVSSSSSQSESEVEELEECLVTVEMLAKYGDVSSEKNNMSIAEEEIQDSKMDKDPIACGEEIVQADQNGLHTTCAEEAPISSKAENGGYSGSEDVSSKEEEVKDSGDNKQESELSDTEPPLKKQKTIEVSKTKEVEESKRLEIKEPISKTEAAIENSGETSEPRPASPTLEDMCKSFVLCEPTTEAADS